MMKLQQMGLLFLYFSFLFSLLSSFNVGHVGAANTSTEFLAGGNPFTPKAFLIRYWKKRVSNDLPKPMFLIDKASPLSAAESVTFSKLADQNALSSTNLSYFCSSANLFCFPDISPSPEKHIHSATIVAKIDNTGQVGLDSFLKYSRGSVDKSDEFSKYVPETNIIEHNDGRRGVFIRFNVTHHASISTETMPMTDQNSTDGRRRGAFVRFNVSHPASTSMETMPMTDQKSTDVRKGVYIRFNVTFRPSTSMEPGKFFREEMLRTGTVMTLPDMGKTKMPERSFLPREISSKLPFAMQNISELKQIFHAGENSRMKKILSEALTKCESAPLAGETNRCLFSAEDLIDFSISVLGRDVAVRTTENTEGSKKEVLIGSIKGINGGKVIKAVSCHQMLFPNLVYYCHLVPKVRVYEADLLDPETKAKINRGVAICHVDTSAWRASHVAFTALGSGPGKIEVCHWNIFQHDLIWTTGTEPFQS